MNLLEYKLKDLIATKEWILGLFSPIRATKGDNVTLLYGPTIPALPLVILPGLTILRARKAWPLPQNELLDAQSLLLPEKE